MCDECKADPWYPDVQALLKIHPMAEHGPAHIVLGDFNTDDASVKHCLHNAEMMKVFIEDHSSIGSIIKHGEVGDMLDELTATIDLLKRMLIEDRGQND